MNAPSLNEEQHQAVCHGEGPLLIIAGAGTGKTTVITERIKHLILEKKISPANMLALTFTEKAAHEMQTRVDVALPYGYTDMWIETFHAFCERIIRQEAVSIGLTPSFTMMTEAETLLFLRKHLFDFDLDYFRPLGNPTKFLQGMLQHFSRLKDDDITPEQYLAFAEKQSKDPDIVPEEIKRTLELAHAFQKYEQLKEKNGVMDFSDLISNTLKLFRTRKNILQEYQKLFQFILVDEFQDTNYAQNEMAILLAGEQQNITVVGDDDQSIYRWRGAAIANMLQFRSHFPKAKVITLNKNYRSTQAILDSAYQLIQHNNPDRLEVKEGIDKKLKAERNEPGLPVTFIFENRVEDEAETVAKRIKEDQKATNRAFNEYAILVRANDHALPFQRALERAHVPYQFLGPGHLFQQPEIKDLTAYLKVLANFEDTASLYRVITMPVFGIEARDIASFMNSAKKNNYSLFEALENADDSTATKAGKDKAATIVAMLKRHLERIPTDTAGQILYYFFEDSGLMGQYLDPGSVKNEKGAENIAKFFTKLQSFAMHKEDASVFAVVDWIELAMELGESPLAAEVDWSANNAVNILTVHSSKGLEFPVVFVVNLVSQRFPGRDRKEQIPVPTDLIREELPTGDENLQEERRLFYVAATRARDELFLTAAKFYGEAKREKKISPFVFETLGLETVDRVVRALREPIQVEQLSLLEMMNDNIAANAQNGIEATAPVSRIPITYLSYSQIQTFQLCPLHYKLRYLMQMPIPPTPAINYGVSVHNTLRDFFQQLKTDENLTAGTIKELLKKNWIHAGYAGKSHEEKAYNQAETMLTGYAQTVLQERPETLAIELPFQFYLKDLKVGGRIDRIDKLPDGRIEIIDYKTGNNVPTERKVKDDLQLTFYALAATEVRDAILHRDPTEIILSLYYLESQQKISTSRTKDDLLLAKDKIRSIADDIAISSFICGGGIFCKSCEYQMLCETFSDR